MSGISPKAAPPLPRVDADTEGWWRETASGRLAMCHCRTCDVYLMPPLERCRTCGGEISFDPVSGTGLVHSFIVVRHPVAPAFVDELPYVVALVELDDQAGLRLSGRMVGVDPATVEIGQRVRVEITTIDGVELDDGLPLRLPLFRRA